MSIILNKCNKIMAEKEEKIKAENIKEGIIMFDIEGTVKELIGEERTITPTLLKQTITPSEGKNGITKITVDAVTKDIDTNIKSENIKEGISILGVTGTLTQKTPSLNLYLQTEEPEDKNGIWFNTSETYNQIKSVNSIAGGEITWELGNTIPYDFYSGSAVSIGTDIYLFGSNNETKYCKYCYKYDTLTDTYAQMTNIPIDFTFGLAAAVGTDIYLFGSFSDFPSHCYKYNTLTDTYKKLADVSYDLQLYSGSAVSVGTDIYLFGGNYSLTSCYKYDTLTDTYTQMANIPYTFRSGGAEIVGTDIYLFGGQYSTRSCYKYDTLTDTYTQMANLPEEYPLCSTALLGEDIYIFNGNNSYKYDILTDTYAQMTNIPRYYRQGSVTSVKNNIYVFGGADTPNILQIAKSQGKTFEDKTLVLLNGTTYNTELITTNITNGLDYKFDNTYYYTTDGGYNEGIDKYVGDGTQWNKI